MTVMVAGEVAIIVGLVRVSEPAHAATPSKASKTAEVNVTGAVLLIIFGFRIPVPERGIIRSSGFKYHSATGFDGCVPFTTRSVIVYGAKVCVGLHGIEAAAVIDPGLVDPTVYAE